MFSVVSGLASKPCRSPASSCKLRPAAEASFVDEASQGSKQKHRARVETRHQPVLQFLFHVSKRCIVPISATLPKTTVACHVSDRPGFVFWLLKTLAKLRAQTIPATICQRIADVW